MRIVVYRDTLHLRTALKKRKLVTQLRDIKQLHLVNLRVFCVNGEPFLTSCSTFGSQVKAGSDVERRTRKISSIIFILRKIGCATKRIFVSRVVLKYSAGFKLKIPLKTLFLSVSNFSVIFFK